MNNSSITVSITLFIAVSIYLNYVQAQSFGSTISISKGKTTNFSLKVNNDETIKFMFLNPQDNFNLVFKQVSSSSASLPYGLEPVMVFEMDIGGVQQLPTYNVIFNYVFNEKWLISQGFEPESIKFLKNNPYTGEWSLFSQPTTVDTVTTFTATQGASTTFDLFFMNEKIAVAASPIIKAFFGENQNLYQNNYTYYSLYTSTSERTPIKLGIFNPDSNCQVGVNIVPKPPSGMTVLPRGVSLVPGSTGFQLIVLTVPENSNISATIIYDMSSNQANINYVFSLQNSIVGLQYDPDEDAYFSLETSYNGYVFYFKPQFNKPIDITYLYLVSLQAGSAYPGVKGRDAYVPANIPSSFGFYYNEENTTYPNYPAVIASLSGVQRPFVMQLTELTSINPFPKTPVPDPTRNMSLLYFAFEIPGDTLNFDFTVMYDHRGNTIDFGQGIDPQSLQLLVWVGGNWELANRATIHPPAIIEASIPSAIILNATTWYRIVASPGYYNSANSIQVIFNLIIMLVITILGILFTRYM
jgi:hypothetical protein